MWRTTTRSGECPCTTTSKQALIPGPCKRKLLLIVAGSSRQQFSHVVALKYDRLLFEMLTLSGVQVGADWTSILKKRHVYREAFSGFDVDAVAKYTEKQMASLSADYGLDLGTVRGTVNNACRILEVPSST
uniref:DNA-3-methyladenine glycosylase I n=1 Tax=Zea mays TaxID=4577 RepID=B4F9X8_MAIZE|nr:unknown [Zea mays]